MRWTIKTFIFDIEANKLINPDNIWCCVVEELDDESQHSFLDRMEFDRFRLDNPSSIWVGHNILEYDIPVLNDVWKINLQDEELIDTLILSRLYSPKILNGHSLEAWGERLGFPKDLYGDFSKFSPELLERCKTDVKLNKQLYKGLIGKIGKWTDAIKLEHEVAVALKDVRDYGFYFDVNKAIDLRDELSEQRAILDEVIHKAYPPTLVGKRVVKEVPFNPNSAKQVIDKLWEAGWSPTEKTDGHKKNTDPIKRDRYDRYGWKLNEANLSTLKADAPEAARSILKRTIYETRVRKLDEWLNLCGDDSAIHGRVIGCGTWTHRMSHSNPNMANISAKKSIKYHTEELKELVTSLGGRMRALWLARPGRVLVGTDAEGIQLRVLAHYMEDEEFTKSVVDGRKEDGTDPHSFNQKRIGRGTRDNAKTFIYAFLLGAGNSKIGEIYSISSKEGAQLKEIYIQSTPGLKKLKSERIPAEAFKGYTVGFDGRRINCDSDHKMMAAYLQGGEAVVMKLAVVIAVRDIKRLKLDAKLINVVHDEMIFECSLGDAEQVRIVTEESIKTAGELLKLKCPMKGEGKVGKTWLDVH